MCEPMTLMMIATTAVSAIGGAVQGIGGAKAANYQAQLHDNNADAAEFRARDAVIRGNEEQKKNFRQASLLKSRQTAEQAANGLDVTFGSALDLAIDTATQTELDGLTIQSNSYREAYGHRVGAQNERQSAAMARSKAKNIGLSTVLGVGGTLLQGGTQAYGQYQSATATI